MAEKFIEIQGGQLTENEALQSSTGAGDAGKIIALDSSGKIDDSMMPTGIGAEIKVVEASESLSAGDLVNIHDDAGTEKVRLADASNGRRAHGFVLSASASAENADVYFSGIITGLTGLTPGADVYLGTGGDISESGATTSGHILQQVGVAISGTEVSFKDHMPITRA